MKPFQTLFQKDGESSRLGELKTRHGKVKTPVFMPVATLGSLKSLSMEDLEELDFEIILNNTYHLALRPGFDLIEQLGGVHEFISWPRSILTDSGGFQVFSLAKRVKITDEGASFNNHIDGALLNFTPENVADIQTRAGVDIQMVLDVCPPAYCSEKELLKALDSTTRWAKRARKAFLEHPKRKEGQLQFGIVQGELNLEKRKEHLLEIMDIDFDGIAIGGLSVGESNQEMYEVLDYLSEFLPKEKAHYLMGVGTPADLCYGVWKGIDMFDCVMPSRNARNGYLFTENGPIQIKNAKFKDDLGPIDESCDCPVCKRYSRAYLRHLFINKELSVYRYLTIHNLHFYKKLVGKIRKAVAEGTIESLFRHYQSLYPGRKKSPSS